MFGDPYRVHADFGDGPEPGLLMAYGPGPAMMVGSVGRIENICLVSRGDGTLHELHRDFVTIDFRYVSQSDRWIDLSDIGAVDNQPDDGSS